MAMMSHNTPDIEGRPCVGDGMYLPPISPSIGKGLLFATHPSGYVNIVSHIISEVLASGV